MASACATPGLRGSRLGGCRLHLGLCSLERDVPLRLDLDPLGFRLTHGRELVRGGLRHARVLLDHRELLLAEKLDVPGLVVDGLDRERVDQQAAGCEVALGGVLDLLLQLLTVHDQFLDRQPADDRPQAPFQHVLHDRVDVLVPGVEETFRRVAQRLDISSDLECRDA